MTDGITVIDRPRLAVPGETAHKYSRGMTAIVGGDMPGATILAAAAAMRIAGYVVLIDGGSGGPHALVRKGWGDVVNDERVGALLIGPGLGLTLAGRARLAAVFESRHRLVIDGDALTMVAQGQALPPRGRAMILTPHEGEFARLFPDLTGSKASQVCAAAATTGATVILKGARTVVASADGQIAESGPGSGWLASAGTGDVLAGIVAALLSTGLSAFEAACGGVWLHGECARLAGPALIADDLPPLLPRAVAACL